MIAELCSLGEECEWHGKERAKLINLPNPIADKYHKGKVQSTLRRGLNVPSIALA